MEEPTSEKHYEDKFEFPLWKMIKEHAEKKDISYLKAMNQVLPEYVRSGELRYRDEEYEDKIIKARWDELKKISGREDTLLYDSRKRGE